MWIKIQAGFSCLLMLVLPWNLVFLPVFDQLCPGLMIGESDAIFHALEMEIQNPIVGAWPCFRAGFPSGGYGFYDRRAVRIPVLGKVRPKVYPRKHGLNHHSVVREWERKINRQSSVCHKLVFTGDSNGDVGPAVIPINWEVIRDPFRPFCNHEEGTVMPLSDHVPCFASPFICIFMEEVRREAGKDHASGRHLVIAFVLSCSENTGWEVESLGLPYYCRILPNSLIPVEHIAVLTPCACLHIMCFYSYVEQD